MIPGGRGEAGMAAEETLAAGWLEERQHGDLGQVV